MNIILGTASEQRKEVFEEMGYEFDVVTADIDEKAIRFDDPKELTLALAKAKADAIQKQLKEPAILITADQVVVWGEHIREKPETKEQAQEYLRTIHEMPIRLINGIVVTNTETGNQAGENDIVNVQFRQIPGEVIDQILRETNVFAWAGGFAVEHPLFAPYVESIDGAEGSPRGLPKELVERLMKKV